MSSRTTPASAIAGRAMPAPEFGRLRSFLGQTAFWHRSLVVRLLVLAAIFLAVPIALYVEFEAADRAKRELLLETIRDKGTALAQALKPTLAKADSIPYFRLNEVLAEMRTETAALKLLFRPNAPGARGFFYVAAAPSISTEALEDERTRLGEAGVLQRLSESCDGEVPLALRMDRIDGRIELLTSIVPVTTSGGCWALVVASSLENTGLRVLGRPYWQSPEVLIAGVIYLALAAFVLVLFFDLWRGLIVFGRQAVQVSAGTADGRFTDRNSIPELTPVAAAFDRLVDTLKGAAESIRRAAEDGAHAFKTPMATIRQALEPLRRRIDPEDERAMQATEAIENALAKLDGLVSAARELEHATADALDPPREDVALDALIRGMVEGFPRPVPPDGPRLSADIERDVIVRGSAEMLETAIENLIENAIGFAPPSSEVRVTLATNYDRAMVTVADRGPGVPPDRLDRIFERYYSDRPGNGGGEPHFGIGLWIVRRNIEAFGGRVMARNRKGGGFEVAVELPLA